MGLFSKKPKVEPKSYDREHEKPAIRCSICTGEQVIGFKDLLTGDFHEVGVIRSPEELERFCAAYGITEEIEKFY